MSVLDDKAAWIADDLATNHNLRAIAGTGDFLEWLKEIFAQLLPLLIGCFASVDDAVAAISSPGWWYQYRLNRFLRRQIDDRDTERRLLGPLSQSFQKLGKTITKDEYVAMTQAV